MVEVIERALDEVYKDYIFIGKEKAEKKSGRNIIDLGMSANKERIKKELFGELMKVNKKYRMFLLEAILEPFRMVEHDEYEEFNKMIKKTKQERLRNVNNGKVLQW